MSLDKQTGSGPAFGGRIMRRTGLLSKVLILLGFWGGLKVAGKGDECLSAPIAAKRVQRERLRTCTNDIEEI